MDCARTETNQEFLAGFHRKVADRRVPLSGSLELTRSCNLRCAHCFHGHVSSPGPQEPVSGGQWLDILDQAARAGCLFLLLTGGEPLLRRDFPDIYRRARELGMVVTVFTNATLVSRELVDLFCELPPFAVEVSLYGARAATHDRVTGVPGSFARAMEGIAGLKDAGLRVQLKTMVLSINSGEIGEMERMAGDMGLRFRMDAALFPCLDGDPAPLAFRVPPEEAAAVEFQSPRRREAWISYYESVGSLAPGDKLFECGAALGSFYVDYKARMLPCLMVRDHAVDLRTEAFSAAWERLAGVRNIPAPEGFTCKTCETRAFCDCCPAFFALENKGELRPSEFICRMARARLGEILSVVDARRAG